MTHSEKIPVMVGSKIIDRAMRTITKGEFAKVTMTWNRLILGLPCLGHYGYPTLAQTTLGWKRRWSILPLGLTPWR